MDTYKYPSIYKNIFVFIHLYEYLDLGIHISISVFKKLSEFY